MPTSKNVKRGVPDGRLNHRRIRCGLARAALLLERLAPIWQVVLEAAPTDAELGSLVAELHQRHAGSMRLVVEHLAEAGRLRPRSIEGRGSRRRLGYELS